jgi:hypothetical protein
MSKAKALNALPNTLVQMYFSTHAYYHNGYMPDHLWDVAAGAGILEARLDVLKGTAEPAAFSNSAILSYLPVLKEKISKELEHLGFPQNHISEAYLDIFVSKKHAAQRLLTGTGTVLTIEGKTIKGKTYTETAFPLRGKRNVQRGVGVKPWWKLW